MASSLSENNSTVSTDSLIRGENLNIVNNLTSKNLLSLSGDPIGDDKINFNVGDVKNDAVEIKIDAVEHSVPKEFTIFSGQDDSSSTEFPIHDKKNDEIQVHKMSRYVFPRVDLGPNEAGKTEIQPLHCLEYAVNLACHRLTDDIKQHWDELCNRDVSFPEVSKSGIVATKYDLKAQIGLYKKQIEKQRYVESLANKQSLDILAADLVGEIPDDYPQKPKADIRLFPTNTPMSSICKHLTRSAQKSPIFIVPDNGPLSDFLKGCQNKNTPFVDEMYNLVKNNPDSKKFLLQILNDIKLGFRHKKGSKVVTKFAKMCAEGRTIGIKKIAYILCYIDGIIKNNMKIRELAVRNLDSEKAECLDKFRSSGLCPEVYIRNYNEHADTKITTALIDSGAECCILSLGALQEIFSMKKSDVSPLDYALSLRSSTGVCHDAVLGTVNLRLSILNEASHSNTNAYHHWSTFKLKFMVTSSEVKLSRIILGAPFMSKHHITLSFSPRPCLSANTPALSGGGRTVRRKLKIVSNEVNLHLIKEITPEDDSAEFLFSNVVMLDNFCLKLIHNAKVELPEKVHFRNYLRKIDANTLSLQQRVVLPVRATTGYSSLTIATDISCLDQPPPKSHSSEVESHSHSLHRNKHNLDAQEISENIECEEIKYVSNFCSLPSKVQNSVLTSVNENVSVNELICNVQANKPETNEYDFNLCNKCGVYTSKCFCPKTCESCNQLKIKGSMCLCDREFVSCLSAKVEQHFEDEDKAGDNLDEIRRNKEPIITDADQTNVSDIVESTLDQMDVTPPDPGDSVDTTHCSVNQKKIVEQLLGDYADAFAKHRYDVGSFTGFVASIEVQPGSSHIEKERPMKIDAKKCLQPIVDNLVKHGILKIADKQDRFLANSHGVAKPVSGMRICGKADEYLMKQTGQKPDYSRLTVDLRGLNSKCPSGPKINLPTYGNLVKKFKNKKISTFDIRSMYWAIHINYESQDLTNFFFNRHVFAFLRLPMGYKNSCFIGQSASELTYSQDTLLKFLEKKGWSLNSDDFPFADVTEFLLVYCDDVVIFTPDDVPESDKIHQHVVEFVLWSTMQYGFKIGKSKFEPYVSKFTFLGHHFDVDRACTMIPPSKLEHFKQFRAPASTAEALSRLSILAYHRTYIPLFKILVKPIHDMALSGTFEWTRKHQLAWKATLLVASLGFANHVIELDAPMFVATDASQIAISYVIFQIINGEIRIISLDSKILKASDRNKASSFREALALMYGLIANEATIKNHPASVICLTDCIGLSQILRSSNNNSKMLEYAIYLGTFSNLSVRYSVGSSLFLADILTREWNKIYLENDKEKISEMWSQLNPPLRKEHIGSVLSPAMLSDALISKPPFGEYYDVFCKRKFYDQALTRYHTGKAEVMACTEPVPTELSFLANLYSGWNGVRMSPTQYNEIIKSIKNFPARHLAKKPTNANLNMLRKSLFDANLEGELIRVMKRKYFPHLCYSRETITANQYLSDLDLPLEVSRIVREAWKANGEDGNVQVTRSTPITGQDDYDLIPENADQLRPGDTVEQGKPMDTDSESGNMETMEGRADVSHNEISESTKYGDSKRTYGTVTGVCEGQLTKSTECNMILGEGPRPDSLQEYINCVMNDQDISEKKWLKMFGVTESRLRGTLEPIVTNILEIFCFLKSGKLLAEQDNQEKLAKIFPQDVVQSILNKDKLSVFSLLKFLVVIIDCFQNNKVSFHNPIVTIPYHFRSDQDIQINFDPTNNTFELYNIYEMQINGYSSVRLSLNLECIIDQILIFEKCPDLDSLSFDIPITKPNVHSFTEFIIHNLIKEDISVPERSLLGKLKIFTLKGSVIYKPFYCSKAEIDRCASQELSIRKFEQRQTLCEKLSSLINMKNNKIQTRQINRLHSHQEKQLFITELVHKAGVQPAFLPHHVKGKIKFDFKNLLNKLNVILLSQYLQRSQNCINKQDIIMIQDSDPLLSEIMGKLVNGNKVNDRFVIRDGILFKQDLIYGAQVFLLCLPECLSRQILFVMHSANSGHMNITSLRQNFKDNFWCFGLDTLLKSVMNSCLFCRLNQSRRQTTVKGTQRTNKDEVTPGSSWQCDILYMPPSSSNHKYILTFTEVLTSYVAGIPIKTLNVDHVKAALETFLSLMPQMREISSDHGAADFGPRFTELLEEFNIRHTGSLPNRSQATGSVELSNKLIQNQLNKVCSELGTYKYWNRVLPKVIQSINTFRPYNCVFSRKQLLYSPYIYCPLGGSISLSNPVEEQMGSYKYLNERRLRGMLKARGSVKTQTLVPGQFVTLNSDSKEKGLVDKLYTPRNKSIFKILGVNKNGFAATIQNLLTGSISEVLSSRLQQLSLIDLEKAHYATPDMYKKLALLTGRLRKRFQHGAQSPGEGLTLLKKLPGLTEGDDHEEIVEEAEGGDNKNVVDEEMFVPREDRVSQEKDGVQEGEGVHDVEGEEDRIPPMVPSHNQINASANTNTLIDDEKDQYVGVKTRYGGKRHVRIYKTEFFNEIGKTYKIKSILKNTSYSKSSNVDISLFRTSERAAFKAHQIGLKSHRESCELPLCDTCQFANNVTRFTWDAKNFSRYLKPLEIWPKLSDRSGPIKHVSFSGRISSRQKDSKLEVNILRLYQACKHNVSLSETNHLYIFKPHL